MLPCTTLLLPDGTRELLWSCLALSARLSMVVVLTNATHTWILQIAVAVHCCN